MKPEGHPPYNFPPISRFDVAQARVEQFNDRVAAYKARVAAYKARADAYNARVQARVDAYNDRVAAYNAFLDGLLRLEGADDNGAPVLADAQPLRVQIHEFAPEELDAIPFDPVLTPDEVEAIRAERELTLRERNRRDQRWAKVAQENAIERAFNARPVGPTTAGKLIP